jgi:hypothetical protein
MISNGAGWAETLDEPHGPSEHCWGSHTPGHHKPVKPTLRHFAEALTRYDHQQERGYDFWVLRDPWGNEFCVLQPSSPELLA